MRLVVLIPLLLAIACHGGVASDGRKETGRPSPPAPATASDQPVLDAALADLATYVGDDSPVAFCGRVQVPLLVSPEPADWPVTAAAVLKRQDSTLWSSMPQADERAVGEAAEDLVSRTTRHAGFVAFRSRNPHVEILVPGATPQPKYPFLAARPIRIWPPGYSADGHIVLVRMSIPWSIHHAEGTYVLANRQGNWLVLVRQFVYYP